MIRYLVLDTQSAEPPIRQVQTHFFTQAPLRTYAVAITNQQHPYHQLRINRGTPCIAVERRQMLTQFAQVEHAVYLAQQVVLRSMIFEIEAVKELTLLSRTFSHHRDVPLHPSSRSDH